jgi:hypothetical protein
MDKLKRVVLLNFQCHEKLDIDLSGETNLISAGNLAGKTAIGRAIKWVLTDRPRGDWMRRIVSGKVTYKTSVQLIFDDETVITREKGKNGLNRYVFNDEKYDNPKEIPYPIAEYVGKAILTLNGTDFIVPLTDDESSTFMMSDQSSSTRGALLNYLTGIDVADRVKKVIAKEIKELSKEKENDVARIAECSEVIASLSNIPDLELKLTDAQSAQDELNTAVASMAAINNILNSLKPKQKGIDRLKVLPSLNTAAAQAKSLVVKMLAIEKYLKVSKSIDKFNGLTNLVAKVNESYTFLEDLRAVERELKKINNAVKELGKRRNEVQNIEINSKKLSDEIQQFKKKSKVVICPTCGSSVLETCIKV